MKFTVSFILYVTTLPLLVQGQATQMGKGKGSLKREFKERHKMKAAMAAASSTNENVTGNIRKPSTPKSDGINAAASRLDLEQMEKIANRMRGQLAKEASGEVKLKDVQKERIDKFMKRYEERKAETSSGGSSKPKSNPLDKANNAGQKKENRHSREFKETRELFLGKSKQERENLADHIRMELMEHEAGVISMPVGVYGIKKKALARYDRINHPEMTKAEERTSWYNQMKEKGVSAEPWTLEERKVNGASKNSNKIDGLGTEKMASTGNRSN